MKVTTEASAYSSLQETMRMISMRIIGMILWMTLSTMVFTYSVGIVAAEDPMMFQAIARRK